MTFITAHHHVSEGGSHFSKSVVAIFLSISGSLMPEEGMVFEWL